MAKPKLAPTRPARQPAKPLPTATGTDGRVYTIPRRGPLEHVEELLLLDQIVLTSIYPESDTYHPLMLTGKDLAILASFAEEFPGGAYAAVDGSDVNLRLRGLAQVAAAMFSRDTLFLRVSCAADGFGLFQHPARAPCGEEVTRLGASAHCRGARVRPRSTSPPAVTAP